MAPILDVLAILADGEPGPTDQEQFRRKAETTTVVPVTSSQTPEDV
ncbi:MAG: hypothetical protein ACWGSQ_01345 [Longimicrobiales bacterium]